ncbi:RING/FYVE/PHD zinc finger superfamily protein [Thalictrum thalictroides]|uniref:RING/FYVE/PHD zinc finger superfamily protein n=1 Tax=Thalictrum thalictroides TaxID=46969 RepID=A0A7J6UVD7_THATH|nr:RING/FYVE/PHD zinc finger superfamily protein [Thalictrum thalictroides]
MHPNLQKVPESWHCEACRCKDIVDCVTFRSNSPKRHHEEEVHESSKRQKTCFTQNNSLKLPDARDSASAKIAARLLSRNFVPKKVETGKVKFLPSEDVCALSFGAKSKSLISLQCCSSLQMGTFNTNRPEICKRTNVSVAASPKAFPETYHSCKSPGHPKANGLKSPFHVPSKPPLSEGSSSVAALTRTGKKHFDNEAPCSPINRVGHVRCGVQEKCDSKKAFSQLDKHAGKAEFVRSRDHVCKEKSVDVVVHSDENGALTSKFNFSNEVLPNPPALIASWEGSFEILNIPYEFHDGFQAYPPGKLSRKAHLAAKQMPKVLQFTLQRRRDVWPEIFDTSSPSGFDIALYFCVGDLSRSREKYRKLLELMAKQDLSLQSRLNGVELLIFHSWQLPVKSQRMDMQFYLWGVFRQYSSVDLKGKQHTVPNPLDRRIGENLASSMHYD